MFDPYTCRRQPNAVRFIPVIVCLLLALLIQTIDLHAQDKGRPHYQLLWRIDGPGLHAPSYLFGTMHLTDRRVFEFSDSVLTALQSTSAFAMEVDMDSLMSHMFAPDGPLLDTVNHMRRVLTPEEYRYVDSLVREKTGAPLAQLKLKRLWFLEKLLVDEQEELKKNAEPSRKPENIFLDAWLHQKATGLNKTVHSLEKVQNQLDIMSANVTEVQKETFLWTLGYQHAGAGAASDRTDRLKERVSYLDALVDLYYEGDLQKISELVSTWEESGEDEGEAPGLEPRNREMAENLAALISKGSVFAAVGVAHLPGEKGMLSLLRTKGYTVTPVGATFTGITQRERLRLDSLKGYSLNRMADGYSVALPSNPIVYPLPNVNRKMYMGANETEAAFAFCMDVPQLATDKRELVNAMISNMAVQGNAILHKSYPINYRNIPGTEAVLLQKKQPFYIRVFVRNNRVFVFMHSNQGADSSARKDFFRSVRFYDIVRPIAVYDTLYRPQLGFSAFLPSAADHVTNASKDGSRPEEVYSVLDDANNISYVLRIEKMQRGYYNTDDRQLLQGLRALLVGQDSTLQLVDSAMTVQDGLQRYSLVYQHASGYTSRLQFIPRGNLAYCLLCTYDGARTDSSYWQRYFNTFRILPLQAQAPVIPFVPADSSFTIAGPERFTGGALGRKYGSSLVDIQYYSAMDSGSNSMYIVEEDKYARYYNNEPDSLLKTFLYKPDTTFVITGSRKYTADNLPAYEAEMKGRYTGLRTYRKAVVAGHTIYRLSAILPEELAGKGYAQQFFAAFHPGSRVRTDTSRLQQKKLFMLLSDLQSADTAVFHRASAYLGNLAPDSSDTQPIINALSKPFPSDTGESNAKVRLLLTLENVAGDSVVHAAEMLFAGTEAPKHRKSILRFLTSLATDSAIRTFLRLAPELPESAVSRGIFSYAFKYDSLYRQYLPAMIATAERSRSFLNALTSYTSSDSLWFAPQFGQYGLERLLPAVVQQFERQLQQWKNRKPGADSSWIWENDVLNTGRILALPGMPASLAGSFRELLADTTMSLCVLGAQGLMSRGIRVDDKKLSSIIANYSNAYTFIQWANENKQLPQIRPLLTQEVLGRSFIADNLTEDYTLTAIEPVTRIKVQREKEPAVWLILYRYKTGDDEDWQYVLNGPHPLESKKLNFEPDLLHWIDDADIVTDKAQLTAAAVKAYNDHQEENEDSKME